MPLAIPAPDGRERTALSRVAHQIGLVMTVNELIASLQKMPRDAEVYYHCAWREKNAEFDTDFFSVGAVGDMGNVVLFEQ
jgi:hypothetical protein